MSRPDARIIVWDPSSGETVETIDLLIRPVVGSGEDHVALYATQTFADVRVTEDMVGMNLSIEISPKAVTSEPMVRAVAALAQRMGVPVG